MDARDVLIDEILAEAGELVLRRCKNRRYPNPAYKYGTAYVVQELIVLEGSREPSNDHKCARDHWTNMAACFLELASLYRTGDPRAALEDDFAAALRSARQMLSHHETPLRWAPTPTGNKAGGGNTVSMVVTALVADLLPKDPLHHCWGPASRVIEAAVADHITLVWAALVRMRIAADPAWLDSVDPLAPPRQPVVRADRKVEDDLVYGADVYEASLYFAPRHVFESVRAARAAFARCETWGDARSLLDSEQFRELRDWSIAREEPDPPDDARIAPEALGAVQPKLYSSQIEEWLPSEVIDQFGSRYSTMMDSGILFPPENEEGILSALQLLGIRCERDDSIEDLFG